MAAVLICLLAAALPAVVWARVEARLDTARAGLGQPLLLQLQIEPPAGSRTLPLDIERQLEGFAVEPLPGAAEGPLSFRLRPLALSVDGIPPLEVEFVTAQGETLNAQSQALDLEVVPLRAADDTELRDIKPPWQVPGGIPLWLAVAAVVVVLGGLAAALVWWMRKRRHAAPSPPPPPVDYEAEFARIAALGLVEAGRLKEYYTLLADTLRDFLAAEIGVDAPEHTTSEIAELLRREGMTAELVAAVEAYLNSADLVKFARFDPGQAAAAAAAEGRRLVVACKRWQAERVAAETAAATTA